MQRGIRFWWSGLACLITASACAGELEHPERFALGVPCEDPAAFVRDTCGMEGCHVPGNLLGTVDLVSPGVAERLIDQDTLMCEGELLVDSNDPARSFLLDKMNAIPRCGAQMPFLGVPLNARERACVTAFVEQLVPTVPGSDASTMDASADTGL